jgi:hypothetical protein
VNVRLRFLAPFTASLAALSTAAAAQDAVPTDIELRSAYCLSVIKADIDLEHKMIAQTDALVKSAPTPELQQRLLKSSAPLHEALTKLEAVLNRLQLYLMPRMGARDPIALTAAMKRGGADFQEGQAMAERCSAKCANLPGDEPAACVNSCVDNDLVARLKACTTPTWLPF